MATQTAPTEWDLARTQLIGAEPLASNELAVACARQIADRVARVNAVRNDEEARFPAESVEALGRSGLLGIMVGKAYGGLELGPRAFADVTEALAEADASVAMIYTMHVCAAAVIGKASDSPTANATLRAIAAGRHLTTLALSERGSRSHFWAPVSRARVAGQKTVLRASKSWVTSAGAADSYVVTTLAPDASTPVASTLYLLDAKARGVSVAAPWDGMGLRANASSPVDIVDAEVTEDERLTPPGEGLQTLLNTVLPLFHLGVAAMDLGLCRAAVAATVAHLKAGRLEHMNTTLAEAYPTLRARLARMQIEADGLDGRICDLVRHLEKPDEATTLKVLEAKAAANEAAISVTSQAMRACGGAAFSRHTQIDRFFRDAQAGAVMAPTVDQLEEFIGRALLGLPLM